MQWDARRLARRIAMPMMRNPHVLWFHYVIATVALSGILFAAHWMQGTTHQARGPVLAASVGLLIAEAVFVFWPVHMVMQRKTSALVRSQIRLRNVIKTLKQAQTRNHLTGLHNRRSLEAHLQKLSKLRHRHEFRLYLIDVDDFKSANEFIGHQNGDELLRNVGRSLRDHLDYDDFIAHIGTDQFVIVSDKAKGSIVRAIDTALGRQFWIDGHSLVVRASVGDANIDMDAAERMNALSDATIAMQFAKGAGGNQHQEFTQDLRDELGALNRLQLELGEAIASGQIEPWFQPQVRLSDGKLHGAEVLARWRHPTRGLLTPDAFLPAAEAAGLMIELDLAIWSAAMRHAHQWEDDSVWHPVISLNAAPATIAHPHLIERFLYALQNSGLTSKQVTIEVLETTLINGHDDMAAINIDSLAECGIGLELDDFGTGYASLSKLTQLPLSGIKLDKSLVSPLPDQGADSIVRAILALAAELGLSVVAEGVEEAEQAAHLNACGCRIAQGYGFGKPMAPGDFTNWLRDKKRSEAHVLPGVA